MEFKTRKRNQTEKNALQSNFFEPPQQGESQIRCFSPLQLVTRPNHEICRNLSGEATLYSNLSDGRRLPSLLDGTPPVQSTCLSFQNLLHPRLAAQTNPRQTSPKPKTRPSSNQRKIKFRLSIVTCRAVHLHVDSVGGFLLLRLHCRNSCGCMQNKCLCVARVAGKGGRDLSWLTRGDAHFFQGRDHSLSLRAKPPTHVTTLLSESRF